MEYYSAMRKKEILTFPTTWMEPEGIRLSEISPPLQPPPPPKKIMTLGNRTTH